MKVLLKFFEISTEMRFVSSLFLYERNIKISLFTMHLEWTIVYYAILNKAA